MCIYLFIYNSFPIIVCAQVCECTSAGFWLNPGQTPPHCTKLEATARKSFNLLLWHDNKNPSIRPILAGTNWFGETEAAWVCLYVVFFPMFRCVCVLFVCISVWVWESERVHVYVHPFKNGMQRHRAPLARKENKASAATECKAVMPA